MCAWGAPRGVADLVQRVASNDPTLRSLCLMRGRRFEESDALELCQALASNSVLQELSTGSHAVSAAAATAFAEALAANTVLESLDVGNSSFGDEGLAALAPGIAASTSLRSLNLERKGISAAGCAALAAALAAGSGGGLAELLLGQNSLGPDGLAALLGGSGLAGLRVLDLSACGLEGGPGLEPLAAAMQESRLPALASLRLDGNELGAGGAAALAAGLGSAGAKALAALHLQRCGLGSEAVGTLSEALSAQLASLDLSGNACTGAGGAAALAHSLAAGRAPRLCRLALCGCGLDDGAIAVLAAALAQRGTAAAAAAAAGPAAEQAEEGLALDLSGNTAGAAALAALAAAPLSALCLHDCKLGGSGEGAGEGASAGESVADAAAAAAATVAYLTSPGACRLLQELDVSGNRLQTPQLLALLEALTPSAGGDTAAKQPPCPRLRLLVIAANPGAADEQVSEAVERLQEARPGLDVVRRAADTGEGGLMH
ncbi:hypothetical protein ABPG75_012393 [Micractinium tetrahymenae]